MPRVSTLRLDSSWVRSMPVSARRPSSASASISVRSLPRRCIGLGRTSGRHGGPGRPRPRLVDRRGKLVRLGRDGDLLDDAGDGVRLVHVPARSAAGPSRRCCGSRRGRGRRRRAGRPGRRARAPLEPGGQLAAGDAVDLHPDEVCLGRRTSSRKLGQRLEQPRCAPRSRVARRRSISRSAIPTAVSAAACDSALTPSTGAICVEGPGRGARADRVADAQPGQAVRLRERAEDEQARERVGQAQAGVPASTSWNWTNASSSSTSTCSGSAPSSPPSSSAGM